MCKHLTIGFFLLFTWGLHGQTISDTIHVKRATGVVFLQNGQRLTPRKLLQITASNPEAHREMKAAKGNYDAGAIFSFAGGFLVGWPLGTAIGGGDPNWTLAAVGAGLIVTSIPFSATYSKQSRKAVEIYNDGLRQAAAGSVEVRLGRTPNGLGLVVNY